MINEKNKKKRNNWLGLSQSILIDRATKTANIYIYIYTYICSPFYFFNQVEEQNLYRLFVIKADNDCYKTKNSLHENDYVIISSVNTNRVYFLYKIEKEDEILYKLDSLQFFHISFYFQTEIFSLVK